MSESKHTEGPWAFLEEGDTDVLALDRPFTICGPDSEDLAEVFHSDEATVRQSRDEAIANARLIAAAPDLLEALYLILPLAKGYAAQNRVGSNAAYVEAAEAAISKAEGQS